MKFKIDHDLHIHSYLSTCSRDPMQTNENIFKYAENNSLKTICLTNHFWDKDAGYSNEWYAPQDYEHISSALPLPQGKKIRFLFGCETELDKNLRLGLTPGNYDKFDFIIIPTTHLNNIGFNLTEEDAYNAFTRGLTWIRRLEGVLNMDLPFHKVGIAHLACSLIAPSREEYLDTLASIPEGEMRRLFTKAAELGVGIELNAADMSYDKSEESLILRPFRIAKECGCKFYLGSDSHHPDDFKRAIPAFKRAIKLLKLTEADKFIIS